MANNYQTTRRNKGTTDTFYSNNVLRKFSNANDTSKMYVLKCQLLYLSANMFKLLSFPGKSKQCPYMKRKDNGLWLYFS